MLLQLGVDVLWTHIFPLLEVEDLHALYNTHPSLRPIIEEYKSWDEEYTNIFSCDTVVPTGFHGFRKVAKRLEAVPFIWGPFSAKVLWDEPLHYVMTGYLNDVYSPNAIDTRPLGAIRQFVSDRGAIGVDSRVSKFTNILDNIGAGSTGDDGGFESDGDQEYGSIISPSNQGSWVHEDGWPKALTRLYTSDSDVYGIDGNTLYYQPHTGMFQSLQFSGRVIKVEFDYSQIFVLVEGVGLVVGFSQMPVEMFTTVIPHSRFPGPIISFCVMQDQGYALLTKANKAFTYIPTSDGAGVRNRVEFPCNIKSIHSFVHKCEMVEVDEGLWSSKTARGLTRLETGCFIALGVNGRVYYYTKRTGVLCEPLPGLIDIVKVVTRHSALFALDSKGKLFFVGATDLIAPGIGMTARENIITDGREILDKTGRPDVLMTWIYPRNIFLGLGEVDLQTDKIYCVWPALIPFKGTVLDVNILGRQVSALVMQEQ